MDSLEIHLRHVDVDLGTARILHDLNLTLCGGEHFAVLGDNGAGKTTLLRLLVGELWPSQRSGGTRTYRLFGEESSSPIGIRPHVRLVTPAMADWYLRHDLRVPVWEIICAGLHNTPFLYHEPTEAEREKARALGLEMGLGLVLDRPMRAVSTGQAKRALLARALIASPKLLAVDELTQGLDRQGQLKLLDALNRIAATGRTRLLVSGHGLLPVPEEVRGRIYLEHGRMVERPTQVRPGALALPEERASSVRPDTVVELELCTVVMEGRAAVDTLSWTIRAGECWGVLGHNGGGKSTLLQLITGYRRPWPGGEAKWFGRAGLTRMREVRGRIGILAPWIGERIEPGATCRDVLLSGLCDGLGVHSGLSAPQISQAEELATAWGMEDWLDRPLGSLSYGQTRQVMLARGVVHVPDLLVLDEPFSGLDASWQARMVELLRHWAATGRTLVLATHSPEYMDELLTHGLVLDQGRLAAAMEWPALRQTSAFAALFAAPGQLRDES
ncbi:ATP-binding cassette domain-containing protein [Desulfomicrobium sp. ZS1]|uniref:ATP-binding cassette domain-containing protein n=1 Tax=Desulfomicrobium sp. ZS1 TaxID=2952228 RepID=UPI0020B28D84|nr:ATP-binding cassette domain-containing protein [Desulfomicrobium sp. ZS1]UTF49699.1 ATP-binding cassette domain-containing protein [Desulfomicrobium sp. ZS1]